MTADPKEGGAPIWHFDCDREADHITVEGDCASQIADSQMGLKQTMDRNVLGHRFNHGCRLLSSMRRRWPRCGALAVFERFLWTRHATPPQGEVAPLEHGIVSGRKALIARAQRCRDQALENHYVQVAPF
jgi:hypothetical protein